MRFKNARQAISHARQIIDRCQNHLDTLASPDAEPFGDAIVNQSKTVELERRLLIEQHKGAQQNPVKTIRARWPSSKKDDDTAEAFVSLLRQSDAPHVGIAFAEELPDAVVIERAGGKMLASSTSCHLSGWICPPNRPSSTKPGTILKVTLLDTIQNPTAKVIEGTSMKSFTVSYVEQLYENGQPVSERRHATTNILALNSAQAMTGVAKRSKYFLTQSALVKDRYRALLDRVSAISS